MAPNFAQSRVYVVLNTVNDKKYVGSTTCPLSKRMVQHRSDAKTNRPGREFPLYAAMREHGIDKFYIELLTDFPCERKEQLNAEEGRHIRGLNTLAPNGYNKLVAGRSSVEYYIENKERIAERQKIYYDTNRVARLERVANYRDTNRDKINADRRVENISDDQRKRNNEGKKAYYANNSDALKEYQKQYMSNEANRSKVRERAKAYKIANKDVLNAKRRERRAAVKLAAHPTPTSASD